MASNHMNDGQEKENLSLTTCSLWDIGIPMVGLGACVCQLCHSCGSDRSRLVRQALVWPHICMAEVEWAMHIIGQPCSRTACFWGFQPIKGLQRYLKVSTDSVFSNRFRYVELVYFGTTGIFTLRLDLGRLQGLRSFRLSVPVVRNGSYQEMKLQFIVILSLSTLAFAATPQQPSPPLYTATLHQLPVSTSASTPKPLAVLSYNPTNPSLASLTSFTPPRNTSSEDDLTQIVTYLPNNDPKSQSYRSSATATYGFHAPYRGRFRIVVEPETGEIVGASWRAWMPGHEERSDAKKHSTGAKAKKATGNDSERSTAGGRGDFDVVTVKRPPPIVFDKPSKGGRGGAAQGAAQPGVEGEEEVQEKTFFQK